MLSVLFAKKDKKQKLQSFFYSKIEKNYCFAGYVIELFIPKSVLYLEQCRNSVL